MNDKLRAIQEFYNNDIWEFAQYVLPHFLFGEIHKRTMYDMADPHRDTNTLVLLPREHLKSVMAALYASWRIARDPTYTILYITADEDLGRLQMDMVKSIFESDRFRTVWPEHFDPDEGRRDRWSAWSINTDHPLRKEYNVRDETLVVKTVRAGKTGRHPKEIIFDDIVVPENAYTDIGRKEVRSAVSQAASLVTSGGIFTAVGTRYHPDDQYKVWEDAQYDDYSAAGEFLGTKPMWHIIEYKVEDVGDGSGTFLWPKEYSPTTKDWYGWDAKTLARKRAEYFSNGEHAQYFAQYYMEPNDPTSNRLDRDSFRYYDPKYLTNEPDGWHYKGAKLNVLAGMDTAQTDAAAKYAARSDFTAVAVVGVDAEGFIYVLELEQFKTDKRSEYWKAVKNLWQYWGFRKIFVEATAGGKFVAKGLTDSIREDGGNLIVEGKPAPTTMSKTERHESVLIPRYVSGSILHKRGGLTKELEDQVVLARPRHDDLEDAVTIALENLTVPARRRTTTSARRNVIPAHSRFGGRSL